MSTSLHRKSKKDAILPTFTFLTPASSSSNSMSWAFPAVRRLHRKCEGAEPEGSAPNAAVLGG